MSADIGRRPVHEVSRSAARIGVATAISRFLGFGRVMAITGILGTTYLGNTFQSANAISNVAFDLLAAGALSAVLVPAFVERFALDEGSSVPDDQSETRELAAGLWGIALVALGLVAIVGVFAAPLIARVLTVGVGDPGIARDQRELTTYLLRWFMPQIPLYGYGTIATAVLHARRRFTAAAIAPIGNTLVMVFLLVAFRFLHGSGSPGLSLSFGERLSLGLAGTLGVAAFVGIPILALHQMGFPVRPRFRLPDDATRDVLRRTAWGVLQHTGIGLLLGVALIVGNSVEGGVVAYQVAFQFFLVPYAVLGAPIHIAVLPELADDVVQGDFAAFSKSIRWSLSRMALWLVPSGLVMAIAATPAMGLLAFGQTTGQGASLVSGALIGLALGTFVYGGFLLLVRGYYALGETKFPAIVAIVTSGVGATVMLGAGKLFEGRGRIIGLGLGHTVAYLLGMLVLTQNLRRRLDQRGVVPGQRDRTLSGVVLTLVVVAVVAAGLVVGAGASVASAAPLQPGAANGAVQPVDRVLVLSLPTLAWGDLEGQQLPAIEQLLSGSSIANLSVRSVNRRTSPAEGYLTIGAGARAVGVAGANVVLQPNEPYEADDAFAAFRRRTGTSASGAAGLVMAIADLERRNAGLTYGAEVGALGTALDDAHIARAVIGNADHDAAGALSSEDYFQREAGLALMGRSGVLSAGDLGANLLIKDRRAPFGLRMAQPEVLRAFDAVWKGRAVVMVEASDLRRLDDSTRGLTFRQYAAARRRTLAGVDRLVAGLLRRVDLRHDAVVVVGPFHARNGPHLTIAAVRSAGVPAGFARSPITRRTAFVTSVDIAPTVLALLGVARPKSMEGRPMVTAQRGATTRAAFSARLSELASVNRDARRRDSMVGPAATVFVIAQVLLCALAVLVLRDRRDVLPGFLAWIVTFLRERRIVEVLALGLLVFPTMTYLATLAPASARVDLGYFAFVVGGSLGCVAVALWLGRRDHLWGLTLILGGLFGVLVLDVLTGARLQLNAVFGYSPTVGGRFAGFGNLAFAQVAAGAIFLAALVSHRLRARRGVVVAAGILVVALLADGMPMWGSDVGGVLASVPAYGVVLFGLMHIRPRLRAAFSILGALTVAIVGFSLIDLARPPETRTHLGRLLESIGNKGLGPLVDVVTRKADSNFSVLTSSVWALLVPVVLAFVAYLVLRPPGHLRVMQDAIPELRPSLHGLLVAGVLGFALNDSGIAIPGMMLGVLNPVLVYLAVRTT